MKKIVFFLKIRISTKKNVMDISYKISAFDWLLKIPQISKVDILEILEYILIASITWHTECIKSDEIFSFPFGNSSNVYDYKTKEFKFNEPIPSFESEYFGILGELFLAGYVDFVTEEPEPVYLSQYKEDKYEAWKYFRDNFLYKGSFDKSIIDDNILIYNGKEYTEETCPRYVKDGITHYLGYRTLYQTSWDTNPKYWSQFNILVARTQKIMEYKEILAEKIYNKFKDLEVEIDDKVNIIRWIGEIKR